MEKKQEMVKVKKEYTKPIVLAATKKGTNFSAGCAVSGGMTCKACQCR